MKCPQCGEELIPNPEQRYTYLPPFVPAKDFCPAHGYQPAPPPMAWRPNRNKEGK